MDNKREVGPKVWNFAIYSVAALSVLIVVTLTGVLDPVLR
jgi:hypothetical protein